MDSIDERDEVLVIVVFLWDGELGIYESMRLCGYHIEYLRMDIRSYQDAITTRVDSETMVIEYVIVLEDMFTYIEVATFDLLLYCGDVFHQHIGLDEWVSLRVRLKTRQYPEELVPSEYAHDIILG